MSREFGSMLLLGHSVLVLEELGLKHLECNSFRQIQLRLPSPFAMWLASQRDLTTILRYDYPVKTRSVVTLTDLKSYVLYFQMPFSERT